MRWTLKAELGAWQLEKKGNCTQGSAGNAGGHLPTWEWCL